MGTGIWVSHIFGDAGAPPLGMGRGWPHRNTPLPMCYLAKFGRIRSDGIRA